MVANSYLINKELFDMEGYISCGIDSDTMEDTEVICS